MEPSESDTNPTQENLRTLKMRRATKPHMEFNWLATTGMKRGGYYDLEKKMVSGSP